MDVEIINATPNPVDVISRAAGICYGKVEPSFKRVEHCYKHEHMSPFEHASATFMVRGISRACSHQLVRHRLASYNQQSQRYCRIDVSNGDWYVKPPIFNRDDDIIAGSGTGFNQFYADNMRFAAINYQIALDAGVRPEDARYLLPEACKTEILVTMNVRELFHFLDTRQDDAAQWEIRELAHTIEDELRICGDVQWLQLVELRHPDY